MDIRQLTYFVSTVEHHSFSRAAKTCCVTVQTISKSVSNLEKELRGKTLFVRKNNGVVPTAFGEAFYHEAKQALHVFRKVEQFGKNFEETNSASSKTTLLLCVPPLPSMDAVRSKLERLIQKLTGLDVDIQITSFTQGLNTLRAFEADALISVGRPSTTEFDIMEVGSISTGVVLANSHPLYHAQAITKEDLETYPVCSTLEFDEHGSGSIINTYLEHGFNLKLHTLHSDLEAAFHFVRDNGLAIIVNIPAVVPNDMGLALKPLAKNDCLSVPFCLLTHKETESNALAKLESFLIKFGQVSNFPF